MVRNMLNGIFHIMLRLLELVQLFTHWPVPHIGKESNSNITLDLQMQTLSPTAGNVCQNMIFVCVCGCVFKICLHLATKNLINLIFYFLLIDL